MRDVTVDDVRPQDGSIVSVRLLSKTFGEGTGSVEALREVDLDIARGSLTVVTGPSGSGKSTLLYCIGGLISPDGGRVACNGTDLGGLDDEGLARHRRDEVGFVFQDFNLLPALDVRQNILLPHVLSDTRVDDAWYRGLVDLLGIADREHHRPAELSGGQRQRVAIGRALIRRPPLVLADEPTGNLDSASSGQVMAILRQVVDDLGHTVVLVTHDAVAASTGDRLVAIADGRVADDRDGLRPDEVESVLKTIRRRP